MPKLKPPKFQKYKELKHWVKANGMADLDQDEVKKELKRLKPKREPKTREIAPKAKAIVIETTPKAASKPKAVTPGKKKGK